MLKAELVLGHDLGFDAPGNFIHIPNVELYIRAIGFAVARADTCGSGNRVVNRLHNFRSDLYKRSKLGCMVDDLRKWSIE